MLCVTVGADQTAVSCRRDALLSYSSSQRKIPTVPVISLCWHYLLGVSADAWQNDIPDSAAALPDNSRASLIKKKIPNRILLMPLAVTPAIFLPFWKVLASEYQPLVQGTWEKKAKGKFYISSGVSKCQRSIKVETLQKQYERGSSVTEPVALVHFYKQIFFPPFVFFRGDKLMNVSRKTAGRRMFRGSSDDCSHSCWSACFPICTQSESCSHLPGLATSVGPKRGGIGVWSPSSTVTAAVWQWPQARTSGDDFDQSCPLSCEDSAPCAHPFLQPASLSAFVNMLACGRGFEME